MIERILLVAGRELAATLLTRAFVIMVLTPIISILAVPLVLLPLAGLGALLEDGDGSAPEAIPLEMVDPSGNWMAPVQSALGDGYALEVVEPDSDMNAQANTRIVFSPDTATSGRYQIQIRGEEQPRLPPQVAPLQRAVDESLVKHRLVAAGLSEDAVASAYSVEHELVWVDAEKMTILALFNQFHGYLIPSAVLFLMFAALSMAGQGLLTSTLEEKATRVAEVLLGAVSPTELLTGKVLGQLGVSLLLALAWGGPSLVGLAVFAGFALGPIQVLYLLAFIGIASLSWAAVMGGIGSAVNDLTEAQHILAPLFMVMMIFFVPALAAIIVPESPWVLTFSLIPPTSAPVMAARIPSTVPPPHWQVWIALLTSGGFALFLLWAAGRLFRIGLLLRSSPPNMRTLIRWVVSG